MISYPSQLYQVLELWMPQNLSRDCILSWIFDHTLGVPFLVFLNGDDAGGETLLEFLLMFGWYGPAENDMW